jgi:hypothetical protein
MIVVEMTVQITQRPMIRTVLSATVEALFMSARVRAPHIVVKLSMPGMVPRMAIIIVVRESRGRGRYHKHRSDNTRCHSHGHISTVAVPRAVSGRRSPLLTCIEHPAG